MLKQVSWKVAKVVNFGVKLTPDGWRLDVSLARKICQTKYTRSLAEAAVALVPYWLNL